MESESSTAETPASQPSRTISSSTIRKATATGAPRKANVLGAKKTQKLGAKKVGDVVDFEAAERKAKEEAERIEKLGYDPEAEQAAATTNAKQAEKSKIVSPTPISTNKPGFGATKGHNRSSSEVERLGMGVAKLGFGQVGGKAAPPAAKKMGFGSTGNSSRSVDDGP